MTQEALKLAHWSDCAVHREPAYPNGECDCGGIVTVADYTALSDKYVALSDKYVALKAQRTEQEPFAWAEFDGEGSYFLRLYENNETYAEDWNKRNPNHIGWVEPIYKYPPQRPWVGLTEQERNDIEDYCEMMIGKPAFDAIEAKLKQKNGYAEEKNT